MIFGRAPAATEVEVRAVGATHNAASTVSAVAYRTIFWTGRERAWRGKWRGKRNAGAPDAAGNFRSLPRPRDRLTDSRNVSRSHRVRKVALLTDAWVGGRFALPLRAPVRQND